MTSTFFRSVRRWWWDWEFAAARDYYPCKRCDGSGFDGPSIPEHICDDCAGVRFDTEWAYCSQSKRAWFTLRLMLENLFWYLRWYLRWRLRGRS